MNNLQGSSTTPLCQRYPQQPGTSPLEGRVCRLHCNHEWCQPCMMIYKQMVGKGISKCPECNEFFNLKDYDALMDTTTPKGNDTAGKHIILTIKVPTSSIQRINGPRLPSSIAIPKEPPQTGYLGGRRITNIAGKWYPGWPGPRK